MNKISNYAQMHFGAPNYQKEHGHTENLQGNPAIAFLCSQKEPQQSGKKQQHISINTMI